MMSVVIYEDPNRIYIDEIKRLRRKIKEQSEVLDKAADVITDLLKVNKELSAKLESYEKKKDPESTIAELKDALRFFFGDAVE